jgi:high-affinity iron transporter
MLQMLVVTMREGMEAFLIVAITAAYLKKTGRVALLPAVWLGTTTAILASIGAALLLQEEAEGPLWESVIAAIAAVLVASLTIYMWRAARHMRVQINERMEREAAKPPGSAWLGIFAFTSRSSPICESCFGAR